jgi:hypothetical protein
MRYLLMHASKAIVESVCTVLLLPDDILGHPPSLKLLSLLHEHPERPKTPKTRRFPKQKRGPAVRPLVPAQTRFAIGRIGDYGIGMVNIGKYFAAVSAVQFAVPDNDFF